jgi:membrane protein implicated in regulation of membrane protease activity
MDTVFSLLLSHPFWVWMAVGAIFLAIELMTGSGWLLWPAGSAAAVAIAMIFLPIAEPAQVAVFAVVTIITTYIGRRYLRPTPASAPDVNDPMRRLIGHKGDTTGAFVDGAGRVFVDGKEWSAVLEGADALAPGAKVEVVAVVGGARLRVRPA